MASAVMVRNRFHSQICSVVIASLRVVVRKMGELREGWVYVLTNAAMPGLVKIGFTMGMPEDRARQLEGTGLPMSFSVAAAFFVVNPAQIEAWAHLKLKDFRINTGREFFRCSVETAKKILLDGCEGKFQKEMVREGGVQSSIETLRSGDVISCPRCAKEIRPFNSVLTDREKGIAKCASCGKEVRFRMERLTSALASYSSPSQKQPDNESRAKIYGNYFRDGVVQFECPNCLRQSMLPPCHVMRCPSCGGSYKPLV